MREELVSLFEKGNEQEKNAMMSIARAAWTAYEMYSLYHEHLIGDKDRAAEQAKDDISDFMVVAVGTLKFRRQTTN